MMVVWNAFNEVIEEKYGGWKRLLKKGIKTSIDGTTATLEAGREVCKENNKLLHQLTKCAAKTSLGAAAAKQSLKLAAGTTVNAGVV